METAWRNSFDDEAMSRGPGQVNYHLHRRRFNRANGSKATRLDMRVSSAINPSNQSESDLKRLSPLIHEMNIETLHRIIDGLETSQNSVDLTTITSSLIEMERLSRGDAVLSDAVEELMLFLSQKFEGHSGPEEKPAWTPPDTFHRSTTKYWVKKDDAIRVKLMILPHLPILGKPSIINSVYLDNPQLSLYHSRLFREDKSSLVRIRWYGEIKPLSNWPAAPLPPTFDIQEPAGAPNVYIERKVHREAWTGEMSSKERSSLPISSLTSFLAGHGPEAQCHQDSISFSYEKHSSFSQLIPMSPLQCQAPPPSPTTFHRADGKDQERRRRATFLREVQHSLICLKAVPVLKTSYRRTAFQRSATNAVRLSFDEQVSMTAYPSLGSVSFDYGILEIKLEDGDQDAPEWLQKIKSSGLLVECPKFSKFSHGISLLFPLQIKRSPSYFVEMRQGQIELHHWRPATIEELKAADEGNEESHRGVLERALLPRDISTGTIAKAGNHTEDGSSSQEEDLQGARGGEKELHHIIDIPPSDDALPADRGGFQCGSFLSSWIKPSAFQSQRSSTAPALVRSRVEPKTFFANERTFLSWLQIAVLLMFASLSLMSSSQPMGGAGGAEHELRENQASGRISHSSRVAGLALAPIALGLFVYALLIYRSRTASIMRREAARFDDQRGPFMIVLLLLIVCSFIFALHITNA